MRPTRARSPFFVQTNALGLNVFWGATAAILRSLTSLSAATH